MIESQTQPPPSSAPRSRTPSMVSATEGPAVLVTGICGRLGKRLARVLHRERPVVGVDRRPFLDKPKDIDHVQVDIRRKKLKDVFRTDDIEAVVHLGVMHDPRASAAEHHSWNVAGFGKLLEYVAQFQVPKLVVLSSANVYGPQAEQPAVSDRGGAAARRAELQRHPRSGRGRHARAELLLEAARDRDGDPAAGAHPRDASTTRRRTSSASTRSPP